MENIYPKSYRLEGEWCKENFHKQGLECCFLLLIWLEILVNIEDAFPNFDFNDNKIASVFLSAINESFLVSVTDRFGKIIYVNGMFEYYSGYDLEDLLGRSHSFFNSGVHDRSMFENLWLTISSGNVWRGIICNKNKEGGFFWCDTTIFPVMNYFGEVDNYVSIRSDITQIKEFEVELEKMALERYARKSFEKNILASNYSKLQSFFYGILNDVRLFYDSGVDGEAFEAEDKIVKSIFSIENLIFYNLGDDCFIEYSDFCVDSLVREILGGYYLDAQSKGVALEFFCNKSDFDGLLVDGNKLLLVVVNLVSLAIENTFSGHVHVNLSVGYKGVETTDLLFSVSDTGVGLPQNIQRELILLIDDSSPVETVFPSLNLEWHVTQRLVRAMGGALEFETKENTGTTIHFSIKARNNSGVNL